MTNHERIKAMSVEEMAEFLEDNCLCCSYTFNDCLENDELCCLEGTKRWLNSEAKKSKFDESISDIPNPVDVREAVGCRHCKLLNKSGYANSKVLDYLPHIVECLQKNCNKCAIGGSCRERRKMEFCETLYSSLAEFIEFVSRRQ